MCYLRKSPAQSTKQSADRATGATEETAERAPDGASDAGIVRRLQEWAIRLLRRLRRTEIAVDLGKILIEEVLRSLDVLLCQLLLLSASVVEILLGAKLLILKRRRQCGSILLLLNPGVIGATIELGRQVIELVGLHGSRSNDVTARARKLAFQAILHVIRSKIELLTEIGIVRGAAIQYVRCVALRGSAFRRSLSGERVDIGHRLVLHRRETGNQLRRRIDVLILRLGLS